MADAGARRILKLLNAGSAELHADFETLATSLVSTPSRIDGVPSHTGLAAVGRIRGFYRQLHHKIKGIETSSRGKDDVVAALDLLDRGWGVFGEALHKGVTPRGKAKARKASRLMKRANEDLKHGRARLK